jgi:DNA polymerase III delta prime subunit
MFDYIESKVKLLPWSEKYRPMTVNNILYHEQITNAIIAYLEKNNLPHLLFYGPPGTGKTSTILAISKQFYKEDFTNMILILNASEERGIETVRNRIKQFVTTSGLPENPETPNFKLIILDEIDAMTEDAQAILRKVVEKYVSNVRFCFICNYLKKINPAIQSRCIIFKFKPIPNNFLTNFISNVCTKEQMKLSTNAIKLIIKRSSGDMRKLLNILQSINMYINNYFINTLTNKNIIIKNSNSNTDTNTESDSEINTEITLVDENCVSKILSCPTDENIIKIILFLQNNNLKSSYNFISSIVINNGISLVELINSFYEYFMDSIINNNDSIIKYPIEKSILIIKNMSIINENLTYCNNDNIQLISFISIFYLS